MAANDDARATSEHDAHHGERAHGAGGACRTAAGNSHTTAGWCSPGERRHCGAGESNRRRDHTGRRKVQQIGVFRRGADGLVEVETAVVLEGTEPTWGPAAEALRRLVEPC